MAFVSLALVRVRTRGGAGRRALCARTARRAPAARAGGGGDGDGDDAVGLDALNKLRGAGEAAGDAGAAAAAAAGGDAESEAKSEREREVARLRAAEKFITVDEGRFECPGCGYVYEPTEGERDAGIAAGTPFSALPGAYACAVCRTPKRAFVPKRKVIAGFADNQSYGLGANSLTPGQKNALIFGALLAAFLLLLSGYALN